MSSRASTLALWAGAIVLLLMPTVLAFQTGGYIAADQLRAAVVAFAVLAVVAVAAPWPLVSGRPALAGLAAMAGFAGWTALSYTWTRTLGPASDDIARVTFYLVVFSASLIVMREPRIRRIAPWALLAGVSVVSFYALAGRFLPDLVPTAAIGAAGARLSQPVTYWNGEGLLTGLGVLLGLACAIDRDAPRWARSIACALVVPSGLACFLTFSRGALIAVIGGLFVLAVVHPRRGTALAYVAGLGATGVVMASLVAFPAVRALTGSRADQVSQGRIVAAIGLLATVAAGAFFAAMLRRRGDWDHGGWRPSFRFASRLAIGGIVVLLIGTVSVSYLSEQTENLSGSAARLGEVKTYRGPYWRVALDTFAHHPLAGVGTASYQVEWRRERTAPKFTYNAHSIYFETLAELGIVGGLLLVTLWGAVATALLRGIRAAPRDPVLPAAAAVLAAFALHVAVDWDWELPAVTLPALLLAAAALAPVASIDSRR
jgi:hypothetical protein